MRRALVVLVALLALVGCSNEPLVPTADPAPPGQMRLLAPLSQPDALSGLIVAPDSDAPGYDREKRFGKGWRSIGSGCDVRDAILARDLADDVFAPGSSCKVEEGTLYGFVVREQDVDIDHVIPLRLAWASGAWAWTDAQRRDFANDPIVLRVERSSSNQSNGAFGPERSDPGGDRCAYARAYVGTVIKYNRLGLPLTVTAPRKDALQKLLATC